jgi:hypothetical protein
VGFISGLLSALVGEGGVRAPSGVFGDAAGVAAGPEVDLRHQVVAHLFLGFIADRGGVLLILRIAFPNRFSLLTPLQVLHIGEYNIPLAS